MPAAPLILISNDDGIHSDGLRALAEAVAAHGRVVVVAPDREQSAVSHALTLHRPLRIDQVAPDRYTVDGTPTDCVNLAINGILRERPAHVSCCRFSVASAPRWWCRGSTRARTSGTTSRTRAR